MQNHVTLRISVKMQACAELHGLVLHLAPTSLSHALKMVSCSLLKHSSHLQPFFCLVTLWARRSSRQVIGRTHVLWLTAPYPKDMYQTEVLASEHSPPGMWAIRSDRSFTMWEDNALPGMLEKQIFRRCAAVGGIMRTKIWGLILLQFSEPENSSASLGKRRKAQARH